MYGDRIAAVPSDPQTSVCRFLGESIHTCANSHGAPLQPGQVCFAEARVQLAELIDRNVDRWLHEQDAMEADADARLTACERWEDEDYWGDAA